MASSWENWRGTTVPRSSEQGISASLCRFLALFSLFSPRFIISRASFVAAPAQSFILFSLYTLGLWRFFILIDKFPLLGLLTGRRCISHMPTRPSASPTTGASLVGILMLKNGRVAFGDRAGRGMRSSENSLSVVGAGMDARPDAYYTNLLQDGVILEDHSEREPHDEFGFTYANPDAQVFTQASQTPTQKGSTPKRAQRGGKFTIEEDKLLVSAYLNVSLDAVQGNGQKLKTYWRRVWDYFHEHMPGSV
ncbi:hypothetical protein RHMOL_Rhmol08G0165200 [Rhododendron molle]|uniref:Uncharacterized protein n=1 Tax=Rhododendron molle TaxID=49168 RepID=A0ACC0MP65_RHOML|nr:hypothetical protein RHMOL_Rhmol08G0165200 [Rhododendron molle]